LNITQLLIELKQAQPQYLQKTKKRIKIFFLSLYNKSGDFCFTSQLTIMTNILTTPRLYLRQFTLNDADKIVALNSDPEVLKYIHEPAVTTIEKAKEILEKHILPQYENNLGRWAIFIKESNTFIGWCGLKFRPELNEIDLGYRFIKQYWGNGFAYESASHVLSFAFAHLKLTTIVGRAHVDNIASLKILQKIGMQFVKEETIDNCPVKTFIIINSNTNL
jgi:[ribosomal protein S5]-alanine N-acetyltransferase